MLHRDIPPKIIISEQEHITTKNKTKIKLEAGGIHMHIKQLSIHHEKEFYKS